LACEAWDDTDPTRAGVYSVRAADGGDLTRLTSTPAGMTDFPGAYAPDGRHLVIQRARGDEPPGRLYTVDVAGDGESEAPLGGQTFDDVGGFSADGRSLLTSARGHIQLIDLDGNVLQTVGEPGAVLFGPVWSPDGQWIAYSQTSGGFMADIMISRPDGSERWQVTRTTANEIAVEWGSGP
jgi:Tol biopolymer transport system component